MRREGRQETRRRQNISVLVSDLRASLPFALLLHELAGDEIYAPHPWRNIWRHGFDALDFGAVAVYLGCRCSGGKHGPHCVNRSCEPCRAKIQQCPLLFRFYHLKEQHPHEYRFTSTFLPRGGLIINHQHHQNMVQASVAPDCPGLSFGSNVNETVRQTHRA
ncbi:Hypothetical predicted protein [Olea europaea subsp. europaea]|uniref:Uncharacterized protein n=1 Tax=Olea europaea subsp. europaea TaxID=158383 RepID=A0A8S0TJD8_OLEEU|nr:Hypothetical predicted protein [Olea europaea subsp. europaea]